MLYWSNVCVIRPSNSLLGLDQVISHNWSNISSHGLSFKLVRCFFDQYHVTNHDFLSIRSLFLALITSQRRQVVSIRWCIFVVSFYRFDSWARSRNTAWNGNCSSQQLKRAIVSCLFRPVSCNAVRFWAWYDELDLYSISLILIHQSCNLSGFRAINWRCAGPKPSWCSSLNSTLYQSSGFGRNRNVSLLKSTRFIAISEFLTFLMSGKRLFHCMTELRVRCMIWPLASVSISVSTVSQDRLSSSAVCSVIDFELACCLWEVKASKISIFE